MPTKNLYTASRVLTSLAAAFVFLASFPGCGGSRVVIGRSNAPTASYRDTASAPKPAEKPAAKREAVASKSEQSPTPTNPTEAAASEKPSQEKLSPMEEAKRRLMSQATPPASQEQSLSTQAGAQNPAPPDQEPKSIPTVPTDQPSIQAQSEPKQSSAAPIPLVSQAKPRSESMVSAPYKLDLSVGGYGLGVGLFDTPVNVAVDEQDESIYVVDQGNYRIQKFDRFGQFQLTWGRQGMGDGEFVEQNVAGIGQVLRLTGDFEFNKPVGISLDMDESRSLTRIHVVDSLNNRIQRFLLTKTPAERFPTIGASNVFTMLTKNAGNSPDTGPDSLEEKYSRDNRQVILDTLYLSSTPGKANSMLLAPFIWGGLGFSQGLLNLPTYCVRDDKDILYVSDTENGRIQGFYINAMNPSTDATFFREWGNNITLPYGAGRLTQPTALAFDNTGFGGFLVLDRMQNGTYVIQRFDRDGQFKGVFATSGDKEGQFRQPVAMAMNSFDNTLFVTDKAKKKVMVYNNKGEFMYEFGGDELADPRGITVLRNGWVYVTDAVKNMVYKYVPK
ncbi:MAG TPA: hypothetical protein VGK71_03135 [Nitrospirota bacterium]